MKKLLKRKHPYESLLEQGNSDTLVQKTCLKFFGRPDGHVRPVQLRLGSLLHLDEVDNFADLSSVRRDDRDVLGLQLVNKRRSSEISLTGIQRS